MSSKRFMTVIGVVSAVALIIAAPAAFAHHKDGHANGGGNGSGTTITEDNDSDGVPNEPDPEGDTDNQHPSGKDKHAEGGNSGNQGNSASNPDNDGHGPERNSCPGSGVGECVDQPGGDGGEDTLDQDGNNGCGNDDDFEDDNEGLCGGLRPNLPDSGDNGGGGNGGGGNGGGDVTEDEVLGDVLTRPSGGPEVLGLRISRAPSGGEVVLGAAETRSAAAAPAALPFTGAALIPFLAIGLGLIGGGTAVVRRSRR